MTMERNPVPPPKIDAQVNSDVSAKKPWKQPVKAKPETVMPEGLQIQVHKRQSLPESYRICNGTSFEPYQPKDWGR